MVILKAIGRFFCAIGRWIRDTAWVQPLLIVGGIFAIIFSIPAIVKGVSSWFNSGNSAEKYYANSQFLLSLEGADSKTSDADKLFDALEEYESQRNDSAATKLKNTYGEKFFVAFVQSGCSGCETNYPGYERLQSSWSSFGMTGEFKLYTIFIDQLFDYTPANPNKQPFDYFYDNHNKFFEIASSIPENFPFYNNVGSGYSDLLEDMQTAANFQSPTNFLIDITSTGRGDSYGISECFFTLTGYNNDTTSYGYAERLRQCWNHTGMFADNWDKK